MIDLKKQLGAQSYCFRGFKKNEEVIEQIKKCGLSAIELCGVHADFTDESGFDDVISLYKAEGVDIVSIGVQGMKGEESVEEKYFDFAARAGAKFMSVDFAIDSTPASFRIAEKLADKYDIRLAIHNHGGPHWLGCSATLGHVFSQTSERIGLCLDTAWALDSREDPIAMVERFADRLYGLHFKDFVFDRARKPEDVVLGTGNVDLKKLGEKLREVDFSGYAVLEYEGDVDNPTPALIECVKAVCDQV